jgi:hypothetical protein
MAPLLAGLLPSSAGFPMSFFTLCSLSSVCLAVWAPLTFIVLSQGLALSLHSPSHQSIHALSSSTPLILHPSNTPLRVRRSFYSNFLPPPPTCDVSPACRPVLTVAPTNYEHHPPTTGPTTFSTSSPLLARLTLLSPRLYRRSLSRLRQFDWILLSH